MFAVLAPPVAPAMVTDALDGAPDTNWRTPADLPLPMRTVSALIVFVPPPRFTVLAPPLLPLLLLPTLNVPAVIEFVELPVFASVRVPAVLCPNPTRKLPVPEKVKPVSPLMLRVAVWVPLLLLPLVTPTSKVADPAAMLRAPPPVIVSEDTVFVVPLGDATPTVV